MRKKLFELVSNTIVLEYKLANKAKGIDRSVLSTTEDICYSALNADQLVSIIYNSIIEYSFNEFEMAERDFQDLQSLAFQERIRYSDSDSEDVKLKYGFFGEVMLYAILKIFFNADAIISKGYFYNPLENSESKGYDSYHLIEAENSIQLWFGEAKFHIKHTSCINDVLNKISTSLSDDYLNKNLIVIRKHRENLNTANSKLLEILKRWDSDPRIRIIEELKKDSISLIYPIFLLFGKGKKGYDDSISKAIKYIEKQHANASYTVSVPCTLFFILLPLDDVKYIKKEVLEWISLKKPLL